MGVTNNMFFLYHADMSSTVVQQSTQRRIKTCETAFNSMETFASLALAV